MLKNIFTGIFIVIFTMFALDYFKPLPSDKKLAFNNISFTQEQKIKAFSVIEKPHTYDKFTDRIANKAQSK